jgi:flagellin
MTTYSTNTAANAAVSYLHRHSSAQSSSISKLSSGSRIVKASDDAASLSIGTKMNADLGALKQAATNANQAQSMLQVADGGLAEISDTLARMKSLATQANAASMNSEERDYIDAEYKQLVNQIDTIANGTKFNDKNLLTGAMGQTVSAVGANIDGSGGIELAVDGAVDAGTYTVNITAGSTETNFVLNQGGAKIAEQIKTAWTTSGSNSQNLDDTIDFGNGVKLNLTNWDLANLAGTTDNQFQVASTAAADFQVGLDADPTGNDVINVSGTALGDATATGLGVSTTLTGTDTLEDVTNNLDSAIETVNNQRSEIGSFMSRFETVANNLATSIENVDASRSALMDVDVAEEMTKFSTTQVQTQAATAMLAQANQLPQNLMRLLQ